MNPWKVSAQFAAYTWFTKRHGRAHAEARQFARENWVGFLPAADEGVGRLLITLAKGPRGRTEEARGRTEKKGTGRRIKLASRTCAAKAAAAGG